MLRILCILAVVSLSQGQISYSNSQTNFGQCQIFPNEFGVCVRISDCPQFAHIASRPLTHMDLRTLRQRSCGRDMICCSQTQPETKPLLPEPGVCGSVVLGRIIGGNITSLDEHVMMALLQYTKPRNVKGFHCGGSLINTRYVLTAAHCVNGKAIPRTWTLTHVRLGEWDLNSEIDCEYDVCADPAIDVAIEQRIPHESYDPNSSLQAHDIALLRLARDVPYTDWIKPICLPRLPDVRTASYIGESMDVVGWGRTETARASNIKLKASLRVVPSEQCNEKFLEGNAILRDSQMCAGGEEGIDSCKGDSGGPLVGIATTPSRKTYLYVAGVVSMGPVPCAQKDFPAVYTRVGSYIDWIESKIQP